MAGYFDQYFNGIATVQNGGTALPQRSTLNFPNGGAVDNPGNNSTDYTPTVTYPLVSPTVVGSSSLGVTASVLATLGIGGVDVVTELWGGSTSAGSANTTLIGTFPLPGQAGAPVTAGTISVDILHVMSAQTPGSFARWQAHATWGVSNGGALTVGPSSQTTSEGSNATAPPSGWTSSLQLNAGSTAVEVVVTGGSTNSVVLAQAMYVR